MALPFFIYPVLVWFIRKFLIFLFSKRTERNNDKLEDLKAAKKKILEEVMETETYKNAKLILERFDPEAKKKAELESTPVRPQMTPRPGQELRHRGAAMRPMPGGTPLAMTMTPPPGARPPLGPGAHLWNLSLSQLQGDHRRDLPPSSRGQCQEPPAPPYRV
ncbi:hypothetical protein INR49_003332 [Caranx melampygus]|nr:hypothetical protein INR49_003332 [Caranx melampygus]